MTTKERCLQERKNGMMVVGRLRSDLTKVLWVEYRIPPGSDSPQPYLFVDADRNTQLYSMKDVDQDTMPIELKDRLEKNDNASKAKMMKRLSRFDDVTAALKEKRPQACSSCHPQALTLFMTPRDTPDSRWSIDFIKNELVREPDGDRVEHRDVLTMALPVGWVEERKNDPDKLREELYHTVDVFVNSIMDSTE